ncbi:hypothetical protein EVAR_53593_1 [Eumeta japonica]|uniref:Uncharacterized protein n=1 Tax=Eumeta variegata TaxID=151549 RepID=A0A4C1YL09_EUMVA|nr:hypothetical protein EVAR_53593_1 [Eumeta japonica]
MSHVIFWSGRSAHARQPVNICGVFTSRSSADRFTFNPMRARKAGLAGDRASSWNMTELAPTLTRGMLIRVCEDRSSSFLFAGFSTYKSSTFRENLHRAVLWVVRGQP